MGYNKSLKSYKKSPQYLTEVTFLSVNMLFLKFATEQAYDMLSYFLALVPVMIYLVVKLFAYLLKFVQYMQIEDIGNDQSLLTPKQTKLLIKVIRNLTCYFGLYFASIEIEKHLKLKDFQNSNLWPAAIALNAAIGIQLYQNYITRQEIASMNQKNEDLEEGSTSTGLFGSAGLTTVINAFTQSTTTLCANGQCFTIYSNTIASNLAAFGVSVTAVNSYLVPLCCLLLVYSLWCLYKEKKSFTYKPFLLGLTGAILIICDTFILRDKYDLKNIPSWIGNILLIIGAIWASRDKAKESNSPFGM